MRVDCGGGEVRLLTFSLHRAEPGDRRKAAAGLSVHRFPFREVSPSTTLKYAYCNGAMHR